MEERVPAIERPMRDPHAIALVQARADVTIDPSAPACNSTSTISCGANAPANRMRCTRLARRLEGRAAVPTYIFYTTAVAPCEQPGEINTASELTCAAILPGDIQTGARRFRRHFPTYAKRIDC